MGQFVEFERDVVQALVGDRLSASELESVLTQGELVSLESTGHGYFLTVSHDALPQQRTVCDKPLLLGRTEDYECGFVVFLEAGQLTLECHTWSDRGVPDDFRDMDVRISGLGSRDEADAR